MQWAYMNILHDANNYSTFQWVWWCSLLLRVQLLQNNACALRFWCLKCTNLKGKCIGQASELKRKCNILSQLRNLKLYQVLKVIKYYQQNKITRERNESPLHARECTLRLRSCAHKVFRVRLYKNNARALLSHIVNSDWLQHACSVRGVYEYSLNMFIYPMWHNRPCYLCLSSTHCKLPTCSSPPCLTDPSEKALLKKWSPDIRIVGYSI